MAGNIYYSDPGPAGWPSKENRSDVTAMPYGPSVPHMFIVIFVIMLPIYLKHEETPIEGVGRPASPGPSSSA